MSETLHGTLTDWHWQRDGGTPADPRGTLTIRLLDGQSRAIIITAECAPPIPPTDCTAHQAADCPCQCD